MDPWGRLVLQPIAILPAHRVPLFTSIAGAMGGASGLPMDGLRLPIDSFVIRLGFLLGASGGLRRERVVGQCGLRQLAQWPGHRQCQRAERSCALEGHPLSGNPHGRD